MFTSLLPWYASLVQYIAGSNLSLTIGHMRKTSTHLLSMIFRTASTFMILFITISLTHETSLSSKFVRPFLQSNYHLTSRQTPNPILETTDVPEMCQRNLARDVSYLTDSRYTLQWIVTQEDELPKPADLLLHHNCGAAAVKKWGKNVGVLPNRADIPHPSGPVLAARVKDDHSIAIQEWAAAMVKGDSWE